MTPSFQKRDSKLMWESFMGDQNYSDGGSDMGNDFDDDFSDDFSDDDFGDSPEVVMEIEPVGPVEVEEPANGDNEMVYAEMKKLVEYSGRLMELVKQGELKPWMLAKLVKASDYVSDVWYSMDTKADFANTGHDQSDDLSQF